MTFAVFAAIAKNGGGGDILDISRVFTSLSLFALLSEPLQTLIMSLVTFLGSVGCFSRIQDFLEKPSRVDPRTCPDAHEPSFAMSSQTLTSSEKEGGFKESVQNLSSPTLKSSVSFPLKEAFQPAPERDAVTIKDGCFGWDTEKEPLLKSINMIIPSDKVTAIVGPVGCGKSTLLKAILGEVPCMGGTIDIISLNVAYCDQTPWHMNESIKASITGVSRIDEQWYATVLRACALDEDLQQLPRGDQTIVGSKGVALSGGQSQRVVRSITPVLSNFSPSKLTIIHRHLQGPYIHKGISLSLTTC